MSLTVKKENYNETIVKVKHSAAHYEKLKAILNKLKYFAQELTFKEIDRDFLKRYEMHLIGLKNGYFIWIVLFLSIVPFYRSCCFKII